MIEQKYSDDLPLNCKELAENMRCSPVTIWRSKQEGYVFEFGRKTTTGHYKDWLRSHHAAEQASGEELLRQIQWGHSTSRRGC